MSQNESTPWAHELRQNDAGIQPVLRDANRMRRVLHESDIHRLRTVAGEALRQWPGQMKQAIIRLGKQHGTIAPLRYSARRCELSLRAAELRSLGSAVTVRQWSRLQRINRAEAERSLNELEAEGFGRWTWHKPAGKGRPTFRFELLGRDTIPGGRDTNAGRCDTIPADADCSPDNSEQPADAPRPASAQAKRPPTGHEKWRDTQDRMLSLFRRGDLPSSIRKTHKLLKGSGYSVSLDTVRRASVKSSPLSDHFRLVRPEHSRTPGAESPAGSLLDELAGQADAQTRRFIDRLTDRQRQDANSVLAEMQPADRLDLIQALASNPDNVNALRNGVTLMDHDAAIEDDRGDWSE